jgi:hypothetical protein
MEVNYLEYRTGFYVNQYTRIKKEFQIKSSVDFICITFFFVFYV